MGALRLRARLVNAIRRRFPHPAVVAKRERSRVATKASSDRATAARAAVLAKVAQMRREVQL
ncbi:hypothetical protein [Sphingobium sp.]|uniref:hypothetical protein n=1 Tax=Sphingobium sp. TaxID=1912891 RepID=UPI003BB4D147